MKRRLGELLVEGGLLNAQQLETALFEQRKSGLRLGQYLVSVGAVTEIQLVGILSRQLKIPRYKAESYPLDKKLAALIPSEMAQNLQMVPLCQDGPLLSVAMTDPLDLDTLDAAEAHTGCEVEAVICTESEFNRLVMNLYGSNMAGLIDRLDIKKEIAEEEESGEYLEVTALQDKAEEAPVVRLVNTILSQAVRERASDVHISPEKDRVQVRFRVDGRLHEVPSPPKSMILPMISRLKILANMDIAAMRVPQDGRFSIKMNHKEVNVRASTIPTIYGENLVLRLLDTSQGIYSLQELGMSAVDQEKTDAMIRQPYGMILSTGPTGSGKTTTLYSILKKINQPDINIITLEDPVEYRVDRIRQTQLNRKAGMTFASGIRSILRQDPDVIMVGEIRDKETAGIAVQAALTGHRVLSTLHTNNAAGAITRLLDMGIAPFLASSVLLLLIAQRLVRRLCEFCSEPFVPPLPALKFWGLDNGDTSQFRQAKGCFNCFHSGYKDRTGVFEVLTIDEMIRDMITEDKTAHEITRAAQAAGALATLKEDVAAKVRMGITSLEEAASVVMV
ncbi:MAG: GspE/PulE family protein [Desulfococcaceae bacterium]